MKFALPALPYERDALQPYLSAETLDIHHGKHHAGYVNKTNELLDGKPSLSRDIKDVFLTAYREGDSDLFRASAQAWNHEHYWNSMRPGGGGPPSGIVAGEIDRRFGDFEAFRTVFVRKAQQLFGSGWIWLVLEGGKISIMSTKDATNPFCFGAVPLCTLDLWEHAYYIDHRNSRNDYIMIFLDHLINWDFVAQNLRTAPLQKPTHGTLG